MSHDTNSQECLQRIQILCETAQALLSHDLKVAVKKDKSNRKPKHQTLAEMAYYQGALRCAQILERVFSGVPVMDALAEAPLEPPAYSLKNAGRE